MQILLFMWLIPLLPLLVAWLTRPDEKPVVMPPSTPASATRVCANAQATAPARQPLPQFSAAYRQRALCAYQEMQAMAGEDRHDISRYRSTRLRSDTLIITRVTNAEFLPKQELLVKESG